MGFTGQQYVGTGFWKCRLSCCLLWTFIQNWLKQLQCPVACFLSNAENTWALVHGLLIHECQRGRCLHSHMRFHVPIPPPTSRSRFWEAFGKLEEDGGHFGCSPLPIIDESHLCTSPVILTHYATLQSRMASRKTLRIAEIDLAAVAWVKNCYSFLPFTSRPSSKQRRAPRPAGTPILSLQQQPCKAGRFLTHFSKSRMTFLSLSFNSFLLLLYTKCDFLCVVMAFNCYGKPPWVQCRSLWQGGLQL